MIDKAREIALKALYKVDKEGAYSNIALDELLKSNKDIVDKRDIGLISEIVYGTTTWKLTIDEIIKKYSNIRIKKISPWILNVLRMGIYQIIFLDKIPKSAAVNESVNLAKRYGHKSSSNFVNAILRKVSCKDYDEFFEMEDKQKRLSLTTSMPSWIIEELLKENTFEKTEEICRACNLKPKVSIRVNRLKTDLEQMKQSLDKENIEYEDGLLQDFLVLNKVKSLENLESFKEGMFTVQDEAAGLTACVLNPRPNEKVLDCCSAPGGKTTHIAEIMNNEGEVEAWDIYEHRTNLVLKNAERLGIRIINTCVQDATKFKEEYVEKFDKVLLDVPCLGIGVIKRKPDIKWKKNSEDVEGITKIQYEILEVCSKYLKKGGSIVYSTCSILKEENEKIIEKFLERNSDFEIERYNFENAEFFKKFEKDSKYIQVFPNEKTDGFFICKMVKK